MKLLINSKPIEFFPNQTGNTLEYFLYCREQALARSQFRVIDAHGRELNRFPTKRSKLIFCELMQEREDSKTMLEEIFNSFHRHFILEVIIEFPGNLECSPWLKGPVEEERLSILAQSQQQLFQNPRLSEHSQLKSLHQAITKALKDDSRVDAKVALRKKEFRELYRFEPYADIGYDKLMANSLFLLIKLSSKNGHYLDDQQIQSIVKSHPHLYRPSILRVYFDLVYEEEQSLQPPVPKGEIESMIIVSAINLMRFSTLANNQRLMETVNTYLDDQFGLESQFEQRNDSVHTKSL